MKKIFFLLFCFLVANSGFSQEIDSVLTLKRNKFLIDLANRDEYVHPLAVIRNGVLKTASPKLAKLFRRFIKVGKHVYLHFGASGKLYQMQDRGDSLLYFVRIDNSENYNYNCSSTFIVDNNEIFDFGGYGFWKTNGTFRRFNFIDREWDSYTVDAELFPPRDMATWYDFQNRFVYLPYQEIVNEGIVQGESKAEIVQDSYRLNFQNKHWEKLGILTKEAFKIFTSQGFFITTDEGFVSIQYGNAYWIDFRHNKISSLVNSEQGQTMLRLGNTTAYYYCKDKVYYFDFEKNKYDSIKLDRTLFTPTDLKIWKKAIDYKGYYYLLYSIVGLLIVLFVIWVFKKRRRPIKTFLVNPEMVDDINPFNETEIGLLELLLEKSGKKMTATVSEINYILGIKDKNAGMQKKVRSDVINAINEKFSLYSQQKILLIQSIRSESDKRYFEYFLNKESILVLKKLIQVK